MPTLFQFLALLIPLIHGLGIVAAADALYISRTSQGAIAWGMALVIFPYLSLPLYGVFGRRRFRGYRELLGKLVNVHNIELASHRESFHKFISAAPPIDRPAEKTFETIANGQFIAGNKVELLIDGERAFPEIFSALTQAKHYILFSYFIVHDDEVGTQLQKVLIEKAAAGVKVRFLYDEVGCKDLPEEYLYMLKNAGVEVSPFGTRQGWGNFFQFNFRNHRKIVVVDGRVAFVGGMNFGDEYLGRSKRFGYWRDTQLSIEGPGVIPIQEVFFADWYWATRRVPELLWNNVATVGDKDLLCLATGPASSKDPGLLFFLEAIRGAKERLWISSPYFVPDDSIVHELQLAALRGVDVRILLPKKPDHYLVWLASFSYIPEVCSFGVKVFRYTKGFLHQKVVLIDHTLAAVGTANLDNRSQRLNFEIMALVADRSFNIEVEQMLIADLNSSREEVIKRFSDLPLLRRLQAKFARLFAPVL